MPTFCNGPSSRLDVLAAAALSHTQPAHTAVTQVQNPMADPEQITIPGLADIPLKLVNGT